MEYQQQELGLTENAGDYLDALSVAHMAAERPAPRPRSPLYIHIYNRTFADECNRVGRSTRLDGETFARLHLRAAIAAYRVVKRERERHSA